jgi:photosystem II stability/assembly factor-like uncharacterized protein
MNGRFGERGNMRSTIRRVCGGLVLVCSLTARAEFARGMSNDAVTDVGPEAGITSTGNQGFLFRGTDEILVNAGRTGIYKTVDRGQIWSRSERGLLGATGVEPLVQGLCQSPSAPEVAYAVTVFEGVSRTTSFGDSWEPPTPLPQVLWSCAVDPSDPAVVYVLAQYDDERFPGRLIKSTDAGRSFTIVGGGLPAQESSFALAVAPNNPLTVYVGLTSAASSGLYVSSDGGLTFEALPNSPGFPFLVYAHPTDDGTLFVIADSGSGLFLSTDRGASFEQIGAGLPGRPQYGLAFDPVDPSIVYTPGGFDGLFRSVDGARTFARLEGLVGLGVNDVAAGPRDAVKPAVIYASTSLGPFRSDDGGSTFAPIHDGFRGLSVNDLAIDSAGRLLLATFNSLGVFRSAGAGGYQIIGDTLPPEIATSLVAIAAAPDDPELYVVAAGRGGPSGVFRTTDGGGSWTRATISGDPAFYIRTRIAFAPSDSSRVYLVSATISPGLFRSNDAGKNFFRVAAQALSSIAVDPRDPEVLFVGYSAGAGGLFKSADGGLTMRLVANGLFTFIAVDPQSPDVIYAASGGAVLRSVNRGETFFQASQGLIGDRVIGLGTAPTQPRRLYVWMHAGGLFRSNDGADSWSPAETGESLRRSTAIAGQTALAIDPSDPERVYLGNASVLQFVNQ